MAISWRALSANNNVGCGAVLALAVTLVAAVAVAGGPSEPLQLTGTFDPAVLRQKGTPPWQARPDCTSCHAEVELSTNERGLPVLHLHVDHGTEAPGDWTIEGTPRDGGFSFTKPKLALFYVDGVLTGKFSGAMEADIVLRAVPKTTARTDSLFAAPGPTQAVISQWQLAESSQGDLALAKLNFVEQPIAAATPVVIGWRGKTDSELVFNFEPPLESIDLKNKGIAFARCRFDATADGIAVLLLRATGSGSLSVAVNGKWVIENPSERMDYHAIPVKRGANELIVKATSPTQLAARVFFGRIAPRMSDRANVYGAASFAPSDNWPIGFRGDGSGYYPGANPPRTWDEASGENICWRIDMPGMTLSQPIVVRGKVFTLAEPNHLVCVDAQSGKILWQRAVDQLEADAFTPEEAKQGREAWADVYGQFLEYCTASAERMWLAGRQGAGAEAGMTRMFPCYYHNGKWGPLSDAPEVKRRIAELDELWRHRKWGGEGSTPYATAPDTHFHHMKLPYPKRRDNPQFMSYFKKLADIERRYGFHLTSPLGMGWSGQTIATPCSDGQFVYVTMGWGQVACYDLDGNRRWLKWFRAKKPFETDDPNRLAYIAFDDFCQNHVSPLLVGDTLLTQVGFVLRALDKQTGSVRWERPAPDKFGIPLRNWGGLRVFDLGGVQMVFAPHGQVYRLSDGEIVMPASKWWPTDAPGIDVEGSPAFDGRRAMMNCQAGTVAYDFAGTRDAVTATTVWKYFPASGRTLLPGSKPTAPDPKSGLHESAGLRQSPAYDPGEQMLYSMCHLGAFYCVDATNGKLVRVYLAPQSDADRCEGIGPIIAGNTVITHQARLTTYLWQSGRDVRPVGKGRLVSQWFDDALARKLTWAEYKKKWIDRGFFYRSSLKKNSSELFAQGDRLYIRTDEALYCIGTAKPKPAQTAGN